LIEVQDTAPAAEAPAGDLSPEQQFVSNVLRLDTGDAARLKRAAGGSLAEARDCLWFYRVVPPVLRHSQVEACFLVATLMTTSNKWFRGERAQIGKAGYRPTVCRSFGASMAQLKGVRARDGGAAQEEGPIDRRFRILLDADLEWDADGSPRGELPYRLRQAVRLLDTADVAVEWVQLLKDIRHWNQAERRVQKRWAADFYDRYADTDQPAPEIAGAGHDDDKDNEDVD
jgi:CRISPR type I-E-associated protein CasB/Cse2